MKLLVGTTGWRGSIERFPLDLWEFSVSSSLPRPKVFAQYREQRPDLALAFRLSPAAVEAGPEAPDRARVVEAARAAEALAIVLPTSPRFAPTPARRRLLDAWVEVLAPVARLVAWEPRGVWAETEAEAWAESSGALLVRDLTQVDGPQGPLVYTRILQLGTGARLSQGAIDRVAERLGTAEEAFVVVDGDGGRVMKSGLASLFESEEV